MADLHTSNIVGSPGSTAAGSGIGGLLLTNALAGGFDPHSPLAWMNLVAGLLSLVIGALQGQR